MTTTEAADRPSPLDLPLLDGRTPTEAHAKVCSEIGHAGWTVGDLAEGKPEGVCPRCGGATTPAPRPDADGLIDGLDPETGLPPSIFGEPATTTTHRPDAGIPIAAALSPGTYIAELDEQERTASDCPVFSELHGTPSPHLPGRFGRPWECRGCGLIRPSYSPWPE